MMVSAGYIFLFALALASHYLPGVAAGYNPYPQPPTGNPYAGLEGQLCDPPFGYSRRTCGGEVLLETQSEPVPTFKYGRNVCRVTETLQSNELEYRYTSACDWVYNYYYHSWVRQCNLVCRPTAVCTNMNQTFTRASTRCCEGFSTRPADDKSHQQYYYNQYYTQLKTEPEGCPVAIGDTLLECLELQTDTSQFLNFITMTTFLQLLNTSGAEITVFAPTNDAFAAMASEVALVPPNLLVGNHLVNGTVQFTDLVSGEVFPTLAGTQLHSTTISYYDYSRASYQQYYWRYTYAQIQTERFVSGAQVVNKDACQTAAGTLHIVDRVIMPGVLNIAEIVTSSGNDYQIFGSLLDTVGLLPFLNTSETSRTLFVVPDDILAEELPPDLLNCLTTYMRRPLNDILLYHIADSVEYNTSLALRTWLHTLLLQHIRVHPFANGTIFLGTDLVEIVTPNIPALNGVVHEVNGLIIPPNFDYGMCQRFVPTPPPPLPQPSSSPMPQPSSPPIPQPSSSPMPQPSSSPMPQPSSSPMPQPSSPPIPQPSSSAMPQPSSSAISQPSPTTQLSPSSTPGGAVGPGEVDVPPLPSPNPPRFSPRLPDP